MTVSTTHISNTFTGDGSTKLFNFTFHAQSESDIVVTVDGVIQVGGYTVKLNSNQEQAPGGWITFTTAPADEAEGEIERQTPIVQGLGFDLDSKIDTKKLTGALDRIVLMLQEAKLRNQGPQGVAGPTGPQGPGGDMTGPGSPVTAGSLAVFDGTTGALLAEGPAPVDGAILKGSDGQWIADSQIIDLPSGLISLWDTNMAAIPVGWEPMDGRTVTINGISKVTPDTRGKYIVAAAQSDTDSSGFTGSTVRSGTVGGTKVHTHPIGSGVVTIQNASPTGIATSSSSAYVPGEGAASGSFAPSGTFPVSGLTHNHNAVLSGNTQANQEAVRPIGISLICIIKVDT